jgi:hypothetical protein
MSDEANNTDTTQEIQAVKLGDEFDSALMGATIRGQFAYSLTQLTMLMMQRMNMTAESAQQVVGNEVVAITRQYGDAAPVFIDDFLLNQKQEEPAKNVILIPGVNHGAVQGFLDPKGLES